MLLFKLTNLDNCAKHFVTFGIFLLSRRSSTSNTSETPYLSIRNRKNKSRHLLSIFIQYLIFNIATYIFYKHHISVKSAIVVVQCDHWDTRIKLRKHCIEIFAHNIHQHRTLIMLSTDLSSWYINGMKYNVL